MSVFWGIVSYRRNIILLGLTTKKRYSDAAAASGQEEQPDGGATRGQPDGLWPSLSRFIQLVTKKSLGCWI